MCQGSFGSTNSTGNGHCSKRPNPCTIKLFTSKIINRSRQAEVFAIVLHFKISLIFQFRLEYTRVEPLMGLHSNGEFLALLANIRPGRETESVKHSSLLPFSYNCNQGEFIVQAIVKIDL